MQLPKPDSNSPNSRYLTALIRELERELQRRPARQTIDGVLYLGGDCPLSLISPNGTVYRVTVDDAGNLVTEEQ